MKTKLGMLLLLVVLIFVFRRPKPVLKTTGDAVDRASVKPPQPPVARPSPLKENFYRLSENETRAQLEILEKNIRDNSWIEKMNSGEADESERERFATALQRKNSLYSHLVELQLGKAQNRLAILKAAQKEKVKTNGVE